MKKVTKMESLKAETFQPLSDEDLALATGSAEVTAEATYSESSGWDAKADIKFKI